MRFDDPLPQHAENVHGRNQIAMSEVDQQTSAVSVEDQGVTTICVENELQRDI